MGGERMVDFWDTQLLYTIMNLRQHNNKFNSQCNQATLPLGSNFNEFTCKVYQLHKTFYIKLKDYNSGKPVSQQVHYTLNKDCYKELICIANNSYLPPETHYIYICTYVSWKGKQ